MNRFTQSSLSRTPLATLPKPQLYLAIGAATLGSLIVLRSLAGSSQTAPKKAIPSPAETLLPTLEVKELKELPYPPHALPGSRDVPSPYGSIRVYEWGPEEGEKVLLIHGISTPSIALTDLAYKLVRKGCRVMLFDLFGRGYSGGPSTEVQRYDSSLYTAQIFLVLQSSTLHWSPFTIVGYSLGGAIAADFTSYFPNLVRGLVLVAPGGLIRTSHISFGSKILYRKGGWVPEWMKKRMVASKLWTGAKAPKAIEPEPEALENAETTTTAKSESKSNAVYLSSTHPLLPGSPNSTVSAVVDWQIKHHAGFVPAFMSTIRYAPIHEQHHRWEVLRDNINKKKALMREIWIVLGETDRIIVADEVAEDAKTVLGEDNVRIKIIEGAGHEVAIERADDVVRVVMHSLAKAEKRSERGHGGSRSAASRRSAR